MTRAEVEETVKKTVAEHLNMQASDVHLESRLVRDLKADSLAILEIMLGLELEFDMDIPGGAIPEDAYLTAQEIVDFLCKALKVG